MQWSTLRVEKCAPRTFGGGAVRRVAARAALVDNRRLPDGAVGIDHDLYLDDEVLGVADTGGDVPAPGDLVADRVEFAGRELAAEWGLGLRRCPGQGHLRSLWRRIGRGRSLLRRQIFQ